MSNKIDLTEGGIVDKLVRIAIPIMATSFIQIAYNLTDMMWVGRNGSNSVAAVGTAGFYPWLAMAFIIFSKIGGEVKVAQSMGQKDVDEVKAYIKSSIELNIFLSIIYSLILIAFNKQLIGLFNELFQSAFGDPQFFHKHLLFVRVHFGEVFFDFCADHEHFAAVGSSVFPEL